MRKSGKERVWKREKGKRGLREKSFFLLLCDGVFYTILSSHFHFTMPPLFFPHSNHTTIHATSTHTTQPHKHTCVLSSFFVCDCLCTRSALNQTTQHYAIMQSPHTAQSMDDVVSEWEREVVIEDTTPQTPITTIK